MRTATVTLILHYTFIKLTQYPTPLHPATHPHPAASGNPLYTIIHQPEPQTKIFTTQNAAILAVWFSPNTICQGQNKT